MAFIYKQDSHISKVSLPYKFPIIFLFGLSGSVVDFTFLI